MASSNIGIQQRQQRAITLKWGPHEINGLDQRRAEAIGLEPAILEVGYGATPAGLPSLFRDPGTCARFVRRTAELLLENSQRWKQIEINTRETNKYYKELLVTSRVREAAYRVAADVLTKILERPSLLNVWENSCPNLLRSKTRELELQTEGTPAYNEALKEKLRIDLIYDAIAELKKIEQERPVKEKDVADKQKKVADMAHKEQAKILKQEAQLAKELTGIGDGSESIARFSACLQAALPSCELSLSKMELLVLPVEVFSVTHLTLLNVSGNSLKELPSEVSRLSALEKLYVNDNQLRSLPSELHSFSQYQLHKEADTARICVRLSTSLSLLCATGNPLEPELMQHYLHGLPALMAHLKVARRGAPPSSSAGRRAREPPPSRPSMEVDLFSTELPCYHEADGTVQERKMRPHTAPVGRVPRAR